MNSIDVYNCNLNCVEGLADVFLCVEVEVFKKQKSERALVRQCRQIE
jgi:hypothetical protein